MYELWLAIWWWCRFKHWPEPARAVYKKIYFLNNRYTSVMRSKSVRYQSTLGDFSEQLKNNNVDSSLYQPPVPN